MTYQVSKRRDVLGNDTASASFDVHAYPSAPIRTATALNLRRIETNSTEASDKIYT